MKLMGVCVVRKKLGAFEFQPQWDVCVYTGEFNGIFQLGFKILHFKILNLKEKIDVIKILPFDSCLRRRTTYAIFFGASI